VESGDDLVRLSDIDKLSSKVHQSVQISSAFLADLCRGHIQTAPIFWQVKARAVENPNAEHVLTFQAKIQVSPSEGVLSIIASYDGAYEHVGFTIVAYSTVPVSWDKNIPKAPFTTEVSLAESGIVAPLISSLLDRGYIDG
jgi:hypothetical protein